MTKICLGVLSSATLVSGQTQRFDGLTSQRMDSVAAKVEKRAVTMARRISLDEAKQQASAQANPVVRLGELQVEAAKQHRLGAQSDFFPKLGASLFNFHYNKFLGQEFTVQRPGGTATIQVPLLGKDQTVVLGTAAQPVTPLFKLRQVYKLARADENIARAKAGMPVSSAASRVEKNYYELLVAQRQLVFTQANATRMEKKWLAAGNPALTAAPTGHDPDLLEIAQALASAGSRVKELTASLNAMLGWPPDTELDLVPPELQVEDISLQEAIDKAMAANPEVIEAQQNVAKARAASSLAKLEYVPDVALLGGYIYNGNGIPALPRDFSFIGLVASYTLFDFGKREHTIKERKAQVSMAQTALELTKAKVAGGVKHSYFALERSRQLSAMMHRMADLPQLQKARYEQGEEDSFEIAASRARIEAEMYQSDLDYLQALQQLKTLMGAR